MSQKDGTHLSVSFAEAVLASAQKAAAEAPKEPAVQQVKEGPRTHLGTASPVQNSAKKNTGGAGSGAIKQPPTFLAEFKIPEIVQLDISEILPSAEKLEAARERVRQATATVAQQKAETKAFLQQLVGPMTGWITALFSIFMMDEKEQDLPEVETSENRLMGLMGQYLGHQTPAIASSAKVAFARGILPELKRLKEQPRWARMCLLEVERIGFLIRDFKGTVRYLGMAFSLARLHEYVVEEAEQAFADLVKVVGEANAFLAESNKAEVAELSAIEAKGKKLSAHDLVHGDINGLRLVNIPDDNVGDKVHRGGRAIIAAKGQTSRRVLFIKAVGHKLQGLFEKKELGRVLVSASAFVKDRSPSKDLALPFFLIRRALDAIQAEDEKAEREANLAQVAAKLLVEYQERAADPNSGLTVIVPTLQLDGSIGLWKVMGQMIISGGRGRERKPLYTINPFFLLEERDGQFRVSAHPGPELVPAKIFAGSTEFRNGINFPGEVGKMIAADRTRRARLADGQPSSGPLGTPPGQPNPDVSLVAAEGKTLLVATTKTTARKGDTKAATGKTKKTPSVKAKK